MDEGDWKEKQQTNKQTTKNKQPQWFIHKTVKTTIQIDTKARVSSANEWLPDNWEY